MLLLAHFGKDEKPEVEIPTIREKAPAEMVGTTRSRVSFFMNRFRKLGFIRYNGELEVMVHFSALFSTIRKPTMTNGRLPPSPLSGLLI
jgi:hypothetical protein